MLKERIRTHLTALGHEVLDLGTHDPSIADDDPDHAERAALAGLDGAVERAVLV